MNFQVVCFNVIIIDDKIFEKNEYFLVHIRGAEENVHIYPPRYVPVHIHDNDSKYKSCDSKYKSCDSKYKSCDSKISHVIVR